jgi:hypothetical protein
MSADLFILRNLQYCIVCGCRLNMEADARQQAVGQAEVLQRTVMQREQELREARDNVRQPLDELAEVQRNASGWWSQLQDMTKRFVTV